MLFQELCEKGQDWDQPLIPELLVKWKDLIEELEQCPVVYQVCGMDHPRKGLVILCIGFVMPPSMPMQQSFTYQQSKLKTS